MKITEVICQILRIENVAAKTASCQDAVLVHIRTDTGLEGIGEADSQPIIAIVRQAHIAGKLLSPEQACLAGIGLDTDFLLHNEPFRGSENGLGCPGVRAMAEPG